MITTAAIVAKYDCDHSYLGAGPEPGDEHKMKQKPDFGQDRYVGHDKLKGKV